MIGAPSNLTGLIASPPPNDFSRPLPRTAVTTRPLIPMMIASATNVSNPRLASHQVQIPQTRPTVSAEVTRTPLAVSSSNVEQVIAPDLHLLPTHGLLIPDVPLKQLGARL